MIFAQIASEADSVNQVDISSMYSLNLQIYIYPIILNRAESHIIAEIIRIVLPPHSYR
jgi:hypothetical protein